MSQGKKSIWKKSVSTGISPNFIETEFSVLWPFLWYSHVHDKHFLKKSEMNFQFLKILYLPLLERKTNSVKEPWMRNEIWHVMKAVFLVFFLFWFLHLNLMQFSNNITKSVEVTATHLDYPNHYHKFKEYIHY